MALPALNEDFDGTCTQRQKLHSSFTNHGLPICAQIGLISYKWFNFTFKPNDYDKIYGIDGKIKFMD